MAVQNGGRVFTLDFFLTVAWKVAVICAAVVLAVSALLIGAYAAMQVM